MSSVYVVCWIFLQTFQTYFCILANSVDPDQTAPRGAVWSWSTLFPKMTFKITSRWQSRRKLLWLAVQGLSYVLPIATCSTQILLGYKHKCYLKQVMVMGERHTVSDDTGRGNIYDPLVTLCSWTNNILFYPKYSHRHVCANSINPDQTVPEVAARSGSALFAIHWVVLDTTLDLGSEMDVQILEWVQ